jgi:lipoprotein-anchoring transpeptidase ErfK/SrfK
MKLFSVILAIFCFGIVCGVAVQNAPYQLSRQSPLNPNTLTGTYDPQARLAIFHNQILSLPLPLAAGTSKPVPVLGTTSVNKRIEVDLTNQHLYAFEGDTKVMDFAISSGKWGRTPTGTFQIWAKLRYTKMSGGSKALHTYYYLPNVPYVMYFYNPQVSKSQGYGIHGAYWHSNFGHPMSHGCINMKPEEAGRLFNWADPALPETVNMLNLDENNTSPPVIIYGTAPGA